MKWNEVHKSSTEQKPATIEHKIYTEFPIQMDILCKEVQPLPPWNVTYGSFKYFLPQILRILTVNELSTSSIVI